MPETINRRCPQCGRKAHDRLLVQCPDCRVPFVLDEPVTPRLTPEQISLIVSQVLGSWKFWAALLVIVGGAAWAVVAIADKVIDTRAKSYMATLEQQTSNHLGAAAGQISNQIAQEFKQPRIKAAIEQTARDRAAEIITNGVQPTLDAFADAIDVAANQLARSTNLIAQLERDALAAQKRIPAPAPATPVEQPAPVTNPAPVAAAPAPTAATNPVPAVDASGVKLTLVNRTLLPAGNGYLLTLFFKTGNSSASGTVEMIAGTFRQTAKILNFSNAGAVPAEPTLNDTGDAARLRFNVNPNDAPVVILEVSAPTIVRISSDSFDSDLTVPIAADKMQLPSASK